MIKPGEEKRVSASNFRARSAAPVSKPEPAKMRGSSFQKPRFAKFRRRFGRAGFETGATEQALNNGTNLPSFQSNPHATVFATVSNIWFPFNINPGMCE